VVNSWPKTVLDWSLLLMIALLNAIVLLLCLDVDRLGRVGLLLLVPKSWEKSTGGCEQDAALMLIDIHYHQRGFRTYQSPMLRPQMVLDWKQLLLVAPAQWVNGSPDPISLRFCFTDMAKA
jgi:hypothetical protein